MTGSPGPAGLSCGPMKEPTEPSEPGGEEGERPGEALRSAVERTLAATAGSAAETRQRARDLLDEVSRRGEAAREELARRGEAAREEVTRRGGAAKDEVQRVGEEAGSRLSEAIAELRSSSREDLSRISERIGALEERLAAIEGALRGSDERESSAETMRGARTGATPHVQAPQAGQSKPQPEVENRPVEGDSPGG